MRFQVQEYLIGQRIEIASPQTANPGKQKAWICQPNIPVNL